jgi:hypothetical protein
MEYMENETSLANEEKVRLAQANCGELAWKKWGPYLSERQWGTVREDYSESGDAWSSFPNDHARSRAYRWGEDGMLGISDVVLRILNIDAIPFWPFVIFVGAFCGVLAAYIATISGYRVIVEEE